ncbi:hypothetical protein N7520_003473 [Penicillium odoratum]|uniref:uncharacterized protein n=1 Tax=Penicillium odoratum TaxID=1167516 RepID=UPI0025466E39|nr:uncharacterized protein N7520_003473 [Penicillium odoratum]KAJ5768914.1 hypothetical protein N7520_003473 [Penicillium odoratum]
MLLPSFLLVVYALFIGNAESAQNPATKSPKSTFTYNQLWNLEKNFWDAFLYPANQLQIQGNESTIFASDVSSRPHESSFFNLHKSDPILEQVQGRVDITRTFDGDELNREYIFGLFANASAISLVGIPVSYNITQFAANDNIVSATTVVTFNATTFGVVIPVTIDTWIKFNKDGKIVQYDAVFRWFDYLVDYLLDATATKYNTTYDGAVSIVTKVLAADICKTHDTYCTGDNQQYPVNGTSCYDFLTEKIRFGKSYELGRNTLLCREVHDHMVQYRPDVHCMHIGPTGGGYCVDDRSYQQTVLQRYFNESWIPFGYGRSQDIWLN